MGDLIGFVYEDQFGPVMVELVLGDKGISRYDDPVAWANQVGCSTVGTDVAGTMQAGDGIGFQSRPTRDIPHVNGFVRMDSRRFEQLGRNRNAPLVVHVGTGHRGPVDFRGE